MSENMKGEKDFPKYKEITQDQRKEKRKSMCMLLIERGRKGKVFQSYEQIIQAGRREGCGSLGVRI